MAREYGPMAEAPTIPDFARTPTGAVGEATRRLEGLRPPEPPDFSDPALMARFAKAAADAYAEMAGRPVPPSPTAPVTDVDRQVFEAARASRRKMFGDFETLAGKDEVEVVSMETEYGTTLEVELPRSFQGKQRVMRGLLRLMEREEESGGGEALQRKIGIFFRVIGTLQANATTPELRAQYDTLYREFMGRHRFNNVFINFTQVGTFEQIKQALDQLRGTDLNAIFRIAGFRSSLQFMDRQGSEYSGISGELMAAMRSNTELRDKAYGISKDSKFNNEDDASFAEEQKEDFEANILLASRMWRATGRRVTQDRVVYDPEAKGKNLEKVGSTPGEEYKPQSHYGFTEASDPKNSEFVMRRLLDFDRWMLTREQNERPILMLMKHINIGQEDFLAALTRKASAAGTETITETVIVQKVTGEPVNVGWIKGKAERAVLNYENDSFWENFDFNAAFGTYSLGDWTFNSLMKPDALRDGLVTQTGSFLQSGSAEALVKTVDAMSYRGTEQHAMKEQFIINLADLLTSNNEEAVHVRERIGYVKADKAALDAMIAHMSHGLKLDEEEMFNLGKNIIGDKFTDNVEVFLSYLKLNKLLSTFLYHLVMGILGQGFQMK